MSRRMRVGIVILVGSLVFGLGGCAGGSTVSVGVGVGGYGYPYPYGGYGGGWGGWGPSPYGGGGVVITGRPF